MNCIVTVLQYQGEKDSGHETPYLLVLALFKNFAYKRNHLEPEHLL